MIPTTIYCTRASPSPLPSNMLSSFSMEHSAHDYRRLDSDSLQEEEEISLEDLEQLKSIVKDIRQNPNLLSQVFPQVCPTMPSTTFDERGSDHSYGSSERREEKEKWFISIDDISCT